MATVSLSWKKQTVPMPTNAFVVAVQRWSVLPVLAAARTDVMNNLWFRGRQLLDPHGQFRQPPLQYGARWPGGDADGPGLEGARVEGGRVNATRDDERVGCAAIGLVWGLAISLLLWAFLLWAVLALMRLWNGG